VHVYSATVLFVAVASSAVESGASFLMSTLKRAVGGFREGKAMGVAVSVVLRVRSSGRRIHSTNSRSA
jgi:hypothetical protein